MASIRLSPDVEAIAQQISEEMGLGSLRTAIEAIVRTQYQNYRAGVGNRTPYPPPAPSLAEVDAIAALDSVL